MRPMKKKLRKGLAAFLHPFESFTMQYDDWGYQVTIKESEE